MDSTDDQLPALGLDVMAVTAVGLRRVGFGMPLRIARVEADSGMYAAFRGIIWGCLRAISEASAGRD